MKKINFEAALKKITSTKGKDKMRMDITPFYDWRILVSIFFVLITTALSFGVYMLIKMNTDTFFTPPPKTSGVTKFDEAGLHAVVDLINEKAEKFEALKTAEMTVVDPSI